MVFDKPDEIQPPGEVDFHRIPPLRDVAVADNCSVRHVSPCRDHTSVPRYSSGHIHLMNTLHCPVLFVTRFISNAVYHSLVTTFSSLLPYTRLAVSILCILHSP